MKLIGMPMVMPFESPTSWLARAALSQAETVPKLAAHFGLRRGEDPDLTVFSGNSEFVAKISEQDPRVFDFAEHMFWGVRSIDPSGRQLLLWSGKRACYRFCPLCLAEDRVKHFPIHWRFKAWRWCPTHDCLMFDRCFHCGELVQLSRSMINAGPEKQGVAFLNHCLVCDGVLSAHDSFVNHPFQSRLLSPSEQAHLLNGRAVLSAIFHRHFYVKGSGLRRQMREMPDVVRAMVESYDSSAITNADLPGRRPLPMLLSD